MVIIRSMHLINLHFWTYLECTGYLYNPVSSNYQAHHSDKMMETNTTYLTMKPKGDGWAERLWFNKI